MGTIETGAAPGVAEHTDVATAVPATSCAPSFALAPLPGWMLHSAAAPHERPQISSPDAAVALIGPQLRGADRELCLLAALDTKHRVLGLCTVSVGTCDHTFMAPREVFRDALLAGASAIVVAHNHPSGDPTPSADDRRITARLSQAGTTIGIELLDHLVIGDPGWTSLARDGVL